MQAITGFFVIGSSLLALFLFFYHIKYIKNTKIGLWGVVLLMDSLFPILDELMSSILKSSYKSTVFLFAELLDFIAFGIVVILFSQHNDVFKKVSWAVFFLFSAIWITELNSYLIKTNIRDFHSLTYTPIFVSMVTVLGVLVYWLGLLRKNVLFFLKDPFFWITLGWFVFFLLTSTTYIPVEFNPFVKKVIIGDVSLAGVLANICYCIGFWKSKEWVLKGYSTHK